MLQCFKAKVENYKELGLNSETAVVFNISSREQVILNTWYGGEMKKGMFSMMNYYLPLKGIASMHCSANTDLNGENTAIFFGLSGTGKTTLSTDPKRLRSAMTSMDGMTKVSSTSKADAMQRLSTWIKSPSRISTTPSNATRFWRTLLWMQTARSISMIRV